MRTTSYSFKIFIEFCFGARPFVRILSCHHGAHNIMQKSDTYTTNSKVLRGREDMLCEVEEKSS